MNKIVNWFHIKLDRRTHDAKFQIFHGNSHQEINLQVRAELNRTHRELGELKNNLEALKISVEDDKKNAAELTEYYERTVSDRNKLIDELTSELDTAKKQLQITTTDHEHGITVRDKYIERVETELDTVKKQLTIKDCKIRDLQSNVDTNYGKYFRIRGKDCHVARLEIKYSEHTTLVAAIGNESPCNERIAVHSLVDTNNESSIQEMVIDMIKKCFCKKST